MSQCRCCSACSVPTPENVLGSQIYDFVYLLLFNCACGSTRAVILFGASDVSAVAA